MVHSEEMMYGGVPDGDGFARNEMEAIEAWKRSCLNAVAKDGKYIIKATSRI